MPQNMTHTHTHTQSEIMQTKLSGMRLEFIAHEITAPLQLQANVLRYADEEFIDTDSLLCS